jgi:hypothetical protein
VHKVDVNEREGKEKIGAVEGLVGRLDGCYWHHVILEEMAEREIDADHGSKIRYVVAEVCILLVAVVL